MTDQQIGSYPVGEGEMTTNSHVPTRRKHGTIENGKALWSLWALVHWAVFATITLSVIYLVVLLQ